MSAKGKQRPKSERPPQTCDICKLRHQKCNSVRPSCDYCQLRSLECTYSHIQAHKIDQSVVRRKSSAPDAAPPPASSYEQRPSDADGAGQTTQDYLSVHRTVMTELANLNLPTEKKEELARAVAEKLFRNPDPVVQPHLLQSSYSFAFEATTEYLVRQLSRLWAKRSSVAVEAIAAEDEDEYGDPVLPTADPRRTSLVAQIAVPPKDHAQWWLNTFLNGPNQMFRICAPWESQQLLDSFYDTDEEISRTSRCLISFQLAVGARFTEDIPEHVHAAMLESAWRLMEDCIEEEDGTLLWIVPLLLLSCVYSLNRKPKSCWLILGTAIRIAQINRIDLEREDCRHMTDVEHSRWREVWRAMIYLDLWISIELGRMPQINESTTKDPFIRNIWVHIRIPALELHVNMTKLAILVGKFLIDVYAHKEKLTLGTYERYLHTVEEWSSSLPESLRYFPDHSSGADHSSLRTEDELASLYLELYYLACVLVFTRPLLLDVIVAGGDSDTSTNPLKLRFLAQTCLDAAIQIGHVSSAMVRRNYICKRSWLTTTINYHACLVLTLSLSAKMSKLRWNLMSAQERVRRQLETRGLDVCMSVLAFCATKDPIADRLLRVTRHFKGLIESQELLNVEQRENSSLAWSNQDPVDPNTQPSTYFTLPTEPVSYGSSINPSISSSNQSPSFDWRMDLSAGSMSAPELFDSSNAADQFSMASGQLTGYLSDPNPVFLNLGHSNIVSFDDSTYPGMEGHLGQMGMAPQHFQTFLDGISQPHYYHPQSQVGISSTC